jgi:enamine deaminase RidA (YjgF/YER057c/UK114 family)
MKSKLMLAAFATLIASSGHAAQVERTGTPTGVIASTVSIPANSKLIYLSGSTASPVDPAKPDEFGDTKAQTLSILTKMKATLASLGLTMGDIVKVNVFLVGVPEKDGRMDAPAMNEVFKTFFGTAEQPNKPARSTVQVAALGRPTTLVEIEAIAAKAP